MKKILTLSAVLLAFFMNTAFANLGGGGCGCMAQMMQDLNLTADQQQKINQIRDQTKSQMQSQKDQMRALKGQINDLIKSEKIDEAKLDSLVNQKKDLMASMMKAKIKMKNQIYNVLDAQQKTKFAAMLDQKMNKGPQGKSAAPSSATSGTAASSPAAPADSSSDDMDDDNM